MATLSVSYTFADGDSVGASVEIATGYPDALAEGVKTCTDLLTAAMATGLAMQDDDEDQD